MPSLLLVCAVVSLLLLGCGSREVRQERAENILNTATENLTKTMETAKEVGQKVQATALDVQERAEQLQGGAEKVMDAAETFREGTEEVKGAMKIEKD